MYYLSWIKIMKTISCIVFTFLLFSCSNRSAISKKLSVCDSLVITFNIPDTDSIIKIVSATEKKAIRKLAGFLEGTKIEELKCGFDGNLIFYSKGEILQEVIFQYKEKSCRRFMFDLDNKVMTTSMSNEAASFFENMVSGNPAY
jgi:hypothetical protein